MKKIERKRKGLIMKKNMIKKIIYLGLVFSFLSINNIFCISGQSFNNKKTYLNTLQNNHQNLNKESFTERNIIITSPLFFEAAKELELYHDNEGLSTSIVNTTWIISTYDEASDPPYTGYATGILQQISIIGYDYSLAKKIINFLRDKNQHPNMEYVTLFGNGKFIPPSYYTYSHNQRTSVQILSQLFPRLKNVSDSYNNRIATDYFYTDPDYDLNPDFMVGRLPVSNRIEAINLVKKIIDWENNVQWDWFKNIYVCGAQPNLVGDMDLKGCYAGEMIASDAINKDYFNGMNITKLFWTEGSFNKASIKNAITNGNAGIVYMMTHGYVNIWAASVHPPLETLTANEILFSPKTVRSPIIVSVACMAGAFDTSLARPLFPALILRGIKSFGEAIVLSRGGGIAYIGTTRATLGSPQIYLDNGEVKIIRERGIAEMLTNVFEDYHNGTITLGDLTKTAITKYLETNNFQGNPTEDETFRVLMSFVLLGDPALKIPIQQSGNSYQQPHLVPLNPDGYTNETYSRPMYTSNTTITIRIETNSPQVNVKLIDIIDDEVEQRLRLTQENNVSYFTFNSSKSTNYLFRVCSEDGKEGWLYFTTITTEEFEQRDKTLH